MYNPNFTFIILTYNEEIQLPRLLQSIKDLDAETFVLDSGSIDNTITVAENFGAKVKTNSFVNHPKQWDCALKNFDVKTSWIIGLDADQTVSPELFQLLKDFDKTKVADVNGIYFNRKNFFQGQWIKHGGYYPFYQLKMFRTGIGFSDMSENMDHRFIVPGKTVIWKTGFLIEENLKENNIEFWLAKHHRYSTLIAEQEFNGKKNKTPYLRSKLFGSPDEKRALLKNLWWKLPLGLRPILYFVYRFVFKLGFLDGKVGRKFHYLHSFWFRNLIDKKLKELRTQNRKQYLINVTRNRKATKSTTD